MSNITLKAKLDLSSNVFNDIEPLKELLQVNFIESLDLTNIYFDTKQLLQLLRYNTSLRSINYTDDLIF